MDITGKILEVSPTQQVKETFQKREFVVEYAENPQYPEFIKFELIQDKCAIVDGVKPGQMVKVHFNLKGRKWVDPSGQTKYFNSLQAWKVDSADAQGAGAPPQASEVPPPIEPPVVDSGADDELPF